MNLEDPKRCDMYKKILRLLPIQGKVALNNFVEEDSNLNFYDQYKIHSEFALNTESVETLYHYTNTQSTKKILESRTWLIKKSSFMNDPKEFTYTIDLSKKILRELKASSKEISCFDTMFKDAPMGDTYIWSFTQNRSSQALFNNYGGEKSGVALGLDSNEILTLLLKHFSHGKETLDDFTIGDAIPMLLKVVYTEEKQREYIKAYLDEWLLAYRYLEVVPNVQLDIAVWCCTIISYLALFFKNPVLRQEEEIRAIIVFKNDSKDCNDFSERRINGVPFVECGVSGKLIKEAIIQTGNTISTRELKGLFEKYGLNNVEVSKSELPY